MPTYPTTEAAASPTATAVTELWTFDPTDTSDDDAWIPRNGATAVINGLDVLLQVDATLSTCGPDGSTGIRMVRSAGSPLLILKIDLDDLATLGSHTRSIGDLWLADACWVTNAGTTSIKRLHFRDAGSDSIGFEAIGPASTTFQVDPNSVAGVHGMSNVNRAQIRVADYGRVLDTCSCWLQDSATPSQNSADLRRVCGDLNSSSVNLDDANTLWIRFDLGAGAGSDVTITNIGIGVIPAGNNPTDAISWDYAP